MPKKPKIKRKVFHVPSVWDGYCLSIKLAVKKEKDQHTHSSLGGILYDLLGLFKQDILLSVGNLLRDHIDTILSKRLKESLKGKRHSLQKVVEKLKVFPRGKRKK